MPELPEVITIRNDLRNVVVEKKVVNIDTHDNYPLNPSAKEFARYVLNHKIVAVENIAKLLLLRLSSGKYIAVHLRMTGSLFYDFDDKYKKITLHFEDGSALHYSTIRKFGFFEVWDEKDKDSYSGRLGKPALESNLGPDEFISLMQRKKTNIKTALLDQRLVSGIGNIYANDALYLAKIHPLTPAGKLNEYQLENLFFQVQKVLQQGIKNRGSSIDRFKDVYGRSGTHQDHFHVYGNKGNRCTQCEEYSIEYVKIQGRGTFYCPGCQPLAE